MPAPNAPSDAGPAVDSKAPAPRPRRDRRERRRRSVAIPFLLASAVPAGAIVWWFTRPADARQAFLDGIPKGVGTRAATAGIALGLLVVLSRIVLPGAKAAGDGLRRVRTWIGAKRPVVRALLSPLALVVEVLWFVTQLLFAVDAVAILACAAAFLVYVARIVKPDLLPGLPG